MYPYRSLPPKAFWKSGVANKNLFEAAEIWDPKFSVSAQDRIATYGSCFAQHIGKALENRGYKWFRTEPAVFGMSKTNLKKYGYNANGWVMHITSIGKSISEAQKKAYGLIDGVFLPMKFFRTDIGNRVETVDLPLLIKWGQIVEIDGYSSA